VVLVLAVAEVLITQAFLVLVGLMPEMVALYQLPLLLDQQTSAAVVAVVVLLLERVRLVALVSVLLSIGAHYNGTLCKD
jgi:hypothetical protein